MTRKRVRHLTLAIVLVQGIGLSVTGATPNFPAAVQAHLDLADRPACTLCHRGTPGRGTATSPFALSMRSRGLVAYNVDSLETALDALEAEHTDSDHDGVPDIAELRAGSDPNVDPNNPNALPPPEYGCAVTSGHGAPINSLDVWLVIGFILWIRRRSNYKATWQPS